MNEIVKFLGKVDPKTKQPLEFVSGVPARDLTIEEWEELSESTREFALHVGLYEPPTPMAVKPKKGGSDK